MIFQKRNVVARSQLRNVLTESYKQKSYIYLQTEWFRTVTIKHLSITYGFGDPYTLSSNLGMQCIFLFRALKKRSDIPAQ